jgi:FKBP-type peptidyl-prolyl cis-trans isomerase SlyD
LIAGRFFTILSGMIAEKNKQITIEYSFKTAEGIELGDSGQSGPFSFILGSGDVVPGLDRHLEGAKVGDSMQFTIPPAEAYGEHREDLVFTVPVERFEGFEGFKVGARVQSTIGGRPAELTITEIGETDVTLDANHPLAGLSLDFDVKVTHIADVPEHLLHHHHHHEHGGGCGCGGSCSCGGH